MRIVGACVVFGVCRLLLCVVFDDKGWSINTGMVDFFALWLIPYTNRIIVDSWKIKALRSRKAGNSGIILWKKHLAPSLLQVLFHCQGLRGTLSTFKMQWTIWNFRNNFLQESIPVRYIDYRYIGYFMKRMTAFVFKAFSSFEILSRSSYPSNFARRFCQVIRCVVLNCDYYLLNQM